MPVDVTIVNIVPRPSLRGKPTDEQVLIVNRTAGPVDMSGWILRDDRNHRYAFPADFTLQPFGSVRVWTGKGTNDDANLFMGRGTAVWNNRGDRAFLTTSQGEMVSRFSYLLPATAREIDADDRAEKFAPIFQFHGNEKKFPCSVEWYLERCALKTVGPLQPAPAPSSTAEPAPSTVELLPVGQVTPDTLVAQASGASEDPLVWLALQDEESRKGNLDSAPVYVRALDRSEDVGEAIVDFQYWVCYAYSGDITPGPLDFAHEGDWEHVTVRVREQTLMGVYTSAHELNEHRWHGPRSVRMEGSRPIIFVAEASHAAYVTAGKQARDQRPDDHTDDGGTKWDDASLQRLTPAPTWLSYSGRWGSPGRFDWTSGPFGPPLQQTWRGETHGPPGWICCYEDDDMGGDIVAWVRDRPGQVLYGDADFTNDEIRSVQLFGVRPGAIVRLYNDKQGKRSKGYCRITVKRFVPSINIRRLATDQADRNNSNVRAVFSGDELAGKVSRIEVD